jgi:VIT1/CCC1 family predicted Fe2+/Mn2+ transporter
MTSLLPPDHHHDHIDLTKGGLRAGVFGAMDGLVSNTALVCGVAAGGASDSAVLLTAVVGLLAGAFSMGVGEWTSVQSQNEVTDRELALERRELSRNPASEAAELAIFWQGRGLSADLAQQVAHEISRDPETALRVHAEAELGIDPGRLPSPWVASGTSLVAFSLGAGVPAVPYLFGGRWSLLVSVVLAAVALFGVGAVVARWSRRPPVAAGVRQLVLGAVAAAATYGLGAAVGTAVG